MIPVWVGLLFLAACVIFVVVLALVLGRADKRSPSEEE